LLVADPEAPQHIWERDFSNGCVDFARSGNYLYLLDDTRSFDIVDISTPASPQSNSSNAAITELWNRTIHASSSHLYLEHRSGKWSVLSLSSPSNPSLVPAGGRFSGAGRPLLQTGDYLITGSDSALHVYDISTMLTADRIGSIPMSNKANAAVVYGDKLYVSSGSHRILVADFANPAAPSADGYLYAPGPVRDLAFVDNLLYAIGDFSSLAVFNPTGVTGRAGKNEAERHFPSAMSVRYSPGTHSIHVFAGDLIKTANPSLFIYDCSGRRVWKSRDLIRAGSRHFVSRNTAHNLAAGIYRWKIGGAGAASLRGQMTVYK
jgi:hypothetical protein